MSERLPIVEKMVDADLLEAFISYQRWAGDDFSIHPLTSRDLRRGERMALEILRRMRRGAVGSPVLTHEGDSK